MSVSFPNARHRTAPSHGRAASLDYRFRLEGAISLGAAQTPELDDEHASRLPPASLLQVAHCASPVPQAVAEERA